MDTKNETSLEKIYLVMYAKKTFLNKNFKITLFFLGQLKNPLLEID